MVFSWRADDGPTLNAGLVALLFFSIANKPYILVNFQGGAWTPCPYPLMTGIDGVAVVRVMPGACTGLFLFYSLEILTNPLHVHVDFSISPGLIISLEWMDKHA